MFDKIAQKHLQVGAKSWRPLDPSDPQRRGGITATRGVFVCNIHHRPSPAPVNLNKPASPPPPPEPSLLHDPPLDPPLDPAQAFDDTPGVHFATPHHSGPTSAQSHHSALPPCTISNHAPSIRSAFTAQDLHLPADEQAHSPPLEHIPSTADLDAAVTEGILMRTREDIEEQERALAELQKAQELLALRESEIREKEEAFQRMLEAEQLRIEEDARLAQEAADRAAILQAEAELQAKAEQAERERQELEREQQQRQREMEERQREMEERQREIEERQRQDEERQRQDEERQRLMEERQREVQERQREIEEKEQAMMIELENERQRLAEEAKLALEESIREQRRLEEEARLEEEMARIRAEDQARLEREEQIAAEQRAKEDAKRAFCNRIQERENALRTHVFSYPRQWNRPMAPLSPLPVRELRTTTYAQAYSSPSVCAYSLPASPVMPLSPLFVPPEVKQAAQAQRRKYDAERRQREEEERIQEQRFKTAQLEAQLKAATEQLAAEQEQADRAQREHEARIQELERRTQAAERMKLEALQEADLKLEHERLLEERNAAELVARQEWEAKRREEEEDMIRRERERVARLQAEQAPAKQYNTSSQSSKSDEDDAAARRRGAEAATYFMAKQALSKPFRTRKLSTSQMPTKTTSYPGRQRRASYTETPPTLTHLSSSRMPSSPGSDFMVFSFEEVPGYAHDVLKEVESSYIMDIEEASALDFLRHTEEGKEIAKRGNRAAVQALMKIAQEIRADAIIRLTTHGPIAITPQQVNFSARGLAVTLKFLSPDRLLDRAANSSMCQTGRPRKDSMRSIHANPVASAPVRGLQTPAMSMKSEPFDVSSPRATSPRTKINRLRFAQQLVSERMPQTPTVRVVPPSNSSKASSPIVSSKDVPASSSSPLQQTSISPPAQQRLPDPPSFTQPNNPVSSPPKTGRSLRETNRSRAESVTRHDPTNKEFAAGPTLARTDKPSHSSAVTHEPATGSMTPGTRQISSPRDSSRSNQDFSSPQSEISSPASPVVPPVELPRSILRQTSPGGGKNRSGRPPRADESPPPVQKPEQPEPPHRTRSRAASPAPSTRSRATSPEATRKRYSATQVPLPATPHQTKIPPSILKTPRSIPLPHSPPDHRKSSSSSSVQCQGIWNGYNWEEHSPVMATLVAPIIPKVVSFEPTGRSLVGSRHSSPLIDLEDDDEFDQYPRNRGGTTTTTNLPDPKPLWKYFLDP